MIRDDYFSPDSPGVFQPVFQRLVHGGDPYMLLADFTAYLQCQQQVDALYRTPQAWTQRAILNVARMGRFSSDRTVTEYARQVWGVAPVTVS